MTPRRSVKAKVIARRRRVGGLIQHGPWAVLIGGRALQSDERIVEQGESEIGAKRAQQLEVLLLARGVDDDAHLAGKARHDVAHEDIAVGAPTRDRQLPLIFAMIERLRVRHVERAVQK